MKGGRGGQNGLGSMAGFHYVQTKNNINKKYSQVSQNSIVGGYNNEQVLALSRL